MKGLHGDKVYVKLAKSRGRPKRYRKSDIKLIDTRQAEDVGGAVAGLVLPIPVVGEQGAKWVLKRIFDRLFRHKTGY